jgi:hypothetical protein
LTHREGPVILIVEDEFLDGLKLARFVRGRWPPIKILATSGFVKVGPDDLPDGGEFLTKPYRGPEMVAKLRKLTGYG